MQVGKSQPTMNLGWIADDVMLEDSERGVILHEFGHVLGLMHEHQNPAMAGVLTLKEDGESRNEQCLGAMELVV